MSLVEVFMLANCFLTKTALPYEKGDRLLDILCKNSLFSRNNLFIGKTNNAKHFDFGGAR